MKNSKNILKDIKFDFPSGLVVFFVALPLCLAIAQVSTGHSELVFSGIIAGVIGGIVVGAFSGSALGVSGPAAGLVVIVSDAIFKLGQMPDGSNDYLYGFKTLLLATLIAGIIQFIAGNLKAGIIGSYFPSSVIKGMLAAIGITIILKELPHAFGYDKDFMGDEAFLQADGHNTFSEIYYAVIYNSPAAIIISTVSLILLIAFETKKIKSFKLFKFVPSALLVVGIGILLNYIFGQSSSISALSGEHLVQLPVSSSIKEFSSFLIFPEFSQISNPNMWGVAVSIAMVASLETLLSLEATDKLDPQKRTSSGNKELKAQGIGNFVSGMIGGLPITQVIVRSSANINSGAKTKLSAIIHGVILFLSVVFIPHILNYIPLATLAAILLLVGYKLAKVSLFTSMFKLGKTQFIPFIVTIAAILATDLLKGIGIGLLLAFFVILKENYKNTFKFLSEDKDPGEIYKMELSDMVTFINKGVLVQTLEKFPQGSHILIDGSKTKYIDYDVLELIHEYADYKSVSKGIKIELINIPSLPGGGSGAH
jgi:MFS superfamily sulfate permease-like transporter